MSSPPTNAARRLALPVVLAAPMLFVLRLHLLVRMDLALDGDESVVGLMSLHALQGKGLALFFYGQNYGLSGLEVLSGALGFSLLGVSAGALRAAVLLLWALGGAFLVAAAARLGTRASAWWALVLMASCPAWLEWSMKARGGYVTAFLFFSASLWLAARLRGRGGWPWLLLGACCTVVLFAQALWFPGLVALGVDFYTGCIYLPDYEVSSSGRIEMRMVKRLRLEDLTAENIERVIFEETGHKVNLQGLQLHSKSL